jgi:hypothetical protein
VNNFLNDGLLFHVSALRESTLFKVKNRLFHLYYKPKKEFYKQSACKVNEFKLMSMGVVCTASRATPSAFF